MEGALCNRAMLAIIGGLVVYHRAKTSKGVNNARQLRSHLLAYKVAIDVVDTKFLDQQDANFARHLNLADACILRSGVKCENQTDSIYGTIVK